MFRTPFTDFMSPVQEGEAVRKCAKFSMQKALCTEAYGAHRAPKMCADEIEDYHECLYGLKQASCDALRLCVRTSAVASRVFDEIPNYKVPVLGRVDRLYQSVPFASTLNWGARQLAAFLKTVPKARP